jgi:hypothetical protein
MNETTDQPITRRTKMVYGDKKQAPVSQTENTEVEMAELEQAFNAPAPQPNTFEDVEAPVEAEAEAVEQPIEAEAEVEVVAEKPASYLQQLINAPKRTEKDVQNWDFTVRKENIANPHTEDATPYYGIFRDDNDELIHICGATYTPVQFGEVHTKVTEPLLNSGRWHASKCGTFNNGRVYYAYLRGDEVDLGNGDIIQNNVAIVASHDGSKKLSILVSPYRPMSKGHLSIPDAYIGLDTKHFAGAVLKLEELGEIIEEIDGVFENTIEHFKSLSAKSLSDDQIEKVLQSMFPKAFDKSGNKMQTAQVAAIKDELSILDAWQIDETRNTAWHLYNTIQGLNQHVWSRESNLDSIFVDSLGRVADKSRDYLKGVMAAIKRV